ncbi:ABC transporter ATP-binding protein [Microlunatus ginsengisoli]|uniref:ABC transporter ATP-binding protein n=1 Tax=Microlunatus ginsengisoli TaxID=363863 RepID=A0ABP6ZD55_9ACTN
MNTPTQPAIRTEGLTKRFGPTLALDHLDLEVETGEVFGFLGPNGAGKSTTIRLILGLIRPTAGRALIFGTDAADIVASHSRLAHVPADVALWPDLTGAVVLALLAALGPGTDRGYRAEVVDRFALDPDRRCATYSTGNRQKVALIAAFATRAQLLILDEPTTGLDPLMEQQFRICLREATDRGQTVFLSSHQLAEVDAVCDRVGILRAGRLVDVAGLTELRRLRTTELTATYAGAVPAGLRADLPGVEAVHRISASTIAVVLSGAPGAALQQLATDDLVAVDVREPSLEEIFLGYYGGAGS